MKKDKARDVARGVLPSKASRSAREDKRNFHATHRHAQNQINRDIVRSITVVDDGRLITDVDLFDDFEPRHVIDGYHANTKKDGASYDLDIGYIVQERRDADNLGPLLAWARGTERQKMVGWSNDDKYAYFKAVLPDTLQGRHALGHVESALDLSNDEFRYVWRHSRYDPVTKEQFRAALARRLSSSKERLALHDFILATIPVAAHTAEANNKVRSRVEARDENGNIRYHLNETFFDPYLRRTISFSRSPIMVEVWVPQIVSATCDDCAFLRNDPLCTTEAINRFIELVWPHGEAGRRYRQYHYRPKTVGPHASVYKVCDYVLDPQSALAEEAS